MLLQPAPCFSRACHREAFPNAVIITADDPGMGPGTQRSRAFTTVPLSGKEKRDLRGRAHHLNPVVSIGAAGVSDAVLAELAIALDGHELVKLRVAAADRKQRKLMIDNLCQRSGAELVQCIGHMAVIYRKRPDDLTSELPC